MSNKKNVLAINGGIPAKKSKSLPPMPGALEINKEEELAVLKVLKSQHLNRYASPWDTESQVDILEKKFAEYMDIKFCSAVSSGTAALHCALVGLGIGPGDEVLVPAFTWMSSATTICIVGAVPVIVDIDKSLNMDPSKIEENITPYTKAIMVVHMRGAAANFDEIKKIAKKHKLFIIEDVAQAIGGGYKGKKLGTLGDVGCFSTQTFKIINTGEGGFVITNNKQVSERIELFHGKTIGEKNLLALNYAMSELEGAVGIVQLKKLDPMINKMRAAKQEIISGIQDFITNGVVDLRESFDIDGDTGVCIDLFAKTCDQADKISAALDKENIGNFKIYRPGNSDFHIYKYWLAIMKKEGLSERGGPWLYAQREINYSDDMLSLIHI